MNSLNKTARMAGFLYLVYMVSHITCDVWRDSFLVLGDASQLCGSWLWAQKSRNLLTKQQST